MRRVHRKRTIRLSFGVLFVFIAGAVSTCKAGARSESPLDRRVKNYSAKATDFIHALNLVSEQLGIRFGIEIDKLPATGAVSVYVAKGTVADVLGALMKYAPGYRWVHADGVIDVLPADGGSSLLGVQVVRFDVSNATPDQIRSTLMSLPEVKAWLVQNDMREHSFLQPFLSSSASGATSVSVHLSNVTVKTLLNLVIQQPGLHAWSFVQYGDRRQYLNFQIG